MTPTPPPPRRSPEVPRDSELDAYDPLNRHDTREVPVTVGVMRAANRLTRVLILFGGLGGGFGGGWLGLKVMRAEAQTVADAGVVRAKEASDEANKVLEQRVALTEKTQLQQADDVREVKQSVNDLNRKLDLVLFKFSIPNPAPATQDAGR